MRRKSFKRDNSNFYKPTEESPSPGPSTPDRPRRRPAQQIYIPAPSMFEMPQTAKPKRSRPHAVSQISFPEPFMPVAELPRAAQPEPTLTPVGVVTHYLDKISVAIIKLGANVRVGDRLVLNGEKGSFQQKLKSMQIDRQNVEMAGRGDDVGIKVNKKVLVGEMVFVNG